MAQGFWQPQGAGSPQPSTTGPTSDAGYQPPSPQPYMPPSFGVTQQTPTQGQAPAPGSLLGPLTPSQQGGQFGSMPPAIYQRMLQGAARYLPGSKSPMDPNFSQNLLAKSGGNWRSMIPDRAKSSFGEFERQFGQMDNFSQYTGNPVIQALMRRRVGGA